MKKSEQINVTQAVESLLFMAGLNAEDFARSSGVLEGEFPSKRLLNERDSMIYLGKLSKPKFYSLQLKKIKLGCRSVRYDIRDLDEYIESKKEA